jgi:hypothetical protein
MTTASIAILLPVTSRKSARSVDRDEGIIPRLHSLALNLHQASTQEFALRVYIGIDSDDEFLKKADLKAMFGSVFASTEVFETAPRRDEPPPICRFWKTLASKAYNEQCDYFILLGDDVHIEITGANLSSWPKLVHQIFSKSVPAGFGCVALNDISSPGLNK